MVTFSLIESTGPAPRCTRCSETINDPWLLTCQWNARARYHFDCAVDINAASARDVLSSSAVEIADRERLLALATARVEAELDANRLTKKKKRATPVEPARDRKGRPRVRVIFLSTPDDPRAPGSGYFSPWDVWSDFTLCSSRYEFYFVQHNKNADARIDPSQPWVAALYWQRSNGAVSNGNPKLVEWKALGIAAPVLAIVGKTAADSALRDAQTTRVRALIAKAGFDPDDAPVVYGATLDEAFHESLLLALDEQADKVTAVATARSVERVADTIDALFEQERHDALLLALTKAIQGYRSARASEKERSIAAIERFMVECPEQASKLLTHVLRNKLQIDRPPLTRIVAAQIRGTHKLPARLEDWLRCWRAASGDTAGLTEAVRAALEAEPDSARSKALTDLMIRVGLAAFL